MHINGLSLLLVMTMAMSAETQLPLSGEGSAVAKTKYEKPGGKSVYIVSGYLYGSVGTKKARILIDTGAEGNMLVRNVGSSTVTEQNQEITENSEVHIGSFRAKLGTFKLFQKLDHEEPTDQVLDLILGRRFLAECLLSYTNGHLTVCARGSLMPQALSAICDSGMSIPLKGSIKEGFSCEVRFNRGKSIPCIVDTGTDLTYIDKATFDRQVNRNQDIKVGQTIKVKALFVDISCKCVQIEEVLINDMALLRHELCIAPSADMSVDLRKWVPKRTIIGMSTLSQFDWVIDLKDKKLYLRKPDTVQN